VHARSVSNKFCNDISVKKKVDISPKIDLRDFNDWSAPHEENIHLCFKCANIAQQSFLFFARTPCVVSVNTYYRNTLQTRKIMKKNFNIPYYRTLPFGIKVRGRVIMTKYTPDVSNSPPFMMTSVNPSSREHCNYGFRNTKMQKF
jgi:hypothetical protein